MAGEVTYQLTEADYVAASREWYRHAAFKRSALFLYATAVIGVFVVDTALARAEAGRFAIAQIWHGLAVAPAAGAVLAAVNIARYASIPRGARRVFGQRTEFQKPMTFVWSDDGMTHNSAHGTATYQWTDLFRWIAGREAILPHVGDRLYFIVPRRALSEEQARDLISTLERSGLRRN